MSIAWTSAGKKVAATFEGSRTHSECLFAQRSVVGVLQKELSEALKGSKKPAQGLSFEEFPPKVLDSLRAFIRHGNFLG